MLVDEYEYGDRGQIEKRVIKHLVLSVLGMDDEVVLMEMIDFLDKLLYEI